MLGPARGRGLAFVVLVVAGLLSSRSVAVARTFDPTCVITDTAMSAYDSMSVKDIQTFLAGKTGPLKSLSFARHDNGSVAPASVLIHEACQSWQISPKVMLTMLQKEQSLLTRTTLAPHTLERAVGAGCPDSGGNKYPGFGNQIWNGARLLDGYGEEERTTPYVPHPLTPSLLTSLTGPVGRTANLATFKLYVYKPSIGAKKPYGDLSGQSCSGNANFWKICSKCFGNPLVKPAPDPRPVSSIKWIWLERQFAVTPYGGVAELAGQLEPTTPAAAAGAKVRLESLGASGWVVVAGSARTVSADGRFSFHVSGTRFQRLRVSLIVAKGAAPVVSGLFGSDIAAVLSRPSQVGSASSEKTATVSGRIVPAHAGVVTVTGYQTVKSSVRRSRTFGVRASTRGVWILKARLTRGAWNVSARHQDAGHARSYSPVGAIAVK